MFLTILFLAGKTDISVLFYLDLAFPRENSSGFFVNVSELFLISIGHWGAHRFLSLYIWLHKLIQ